MWRQVVRFRQAADVRRSRPMSSASATVVNGPCIVHKRGADILHDPWFNKDTGFTLTERNRLGLQGLLPPRVMSFTLLYNRFMEAYRSMEESTKCQPEASISLTKWRILNRLHDRNETLYYRVSVSTHAARQFSSGLGHCHSICRHFSLLHLHVLIDSIKSFAPIIYTPTVGLVCQNYSGLFRRPRGMYSGAKAKGEMMSMVYNWPSQEVDMIVVTDGSRILGLGDPGVQGIGIPIGKLDMYVAAAGINPRRQILPVMLDVGTNNEKLLEDRLLYHRLEIIFYMMKI